MVVQKQLIKSSQMKLYDPTDSEYIIFFLNIESEVFL